VKLSAECFGTHATNCATGHGLTGRAPEAIADLGPRDVGGAEQRPGYHSLRGVLQLSRITARNSFLLHSLEQVPIIGLLTRRDQREVCSTVLYRLMEGHIAAPHLCHFDLNRPSSGRK
jgi:hypothetical protein